MTDEPSELCEKLKQNTSSRTAKSLDIIHQICTEQAERGSTDFSIATIGLLSEAALGPKTQTIRNKTGEKYRALIQSWAEFKKPLKVISGKVREKDSWVNDIAEPRIKWLVMDLLAQNSKLKGQLQLAKEQANVHIDLRPVAKNGNSAGSDPLKLFNAELLSSEREALERAISLEGQRKHGWSTDERGRVRDKDGNEIFQVGFISAVRKILSLKV